MEKIYKIYIKFKLQAKIIETAALWRLERIGKSCEIKGNNYHSNVSQSNQKL